MYTYMCALMCVMHVTAHTCGGQRTTFKNLPQWVLEIELTYSNLVIELANSSTPTLFSEIKVSQGDLSLTKGSAWSCFPSTG